MKTQPCKASQLVERLQSLMAEHGDLPILARDADTQLRLPIGLIYRVADRDDVERLEIRTDYHGAPRGYIEPLSGNHPGIPDSSGGGA